MSLDGYLFAVKKTRVDIKILLLAVSPLPVSKPLLFSSPNSPLKSQRDMQASSEFW
jgi:hypothetical protein